MSWLFPIVIGPPGLHAQIRVYWGKVASGASRFRVFPWAN
jgi:hypothetical protein